MDVVFERARKQAGKAALPRSLANPHAHIARLLAEDEERRKQAETQRYQNAEFVNVLYADTPVHGSRALQYVHMDHTELDIELVSLKTGKSLGRPWLSLAIDAFTRRIVGIYLSFDPPSYRSNMMLLRDIVRRHRRLPQFIVVDNGADFRSEDFKHFAELMRIHVRYCPAGNPRHGSVMERIFGRIHTEYIHNLAGNTNREGCAPSGSANQSSGISVASRACRRRASNGRPGWPNSRAWHHWTVTPWPLGAPCWASRAWRRNPTVGARAAWPRTKPTTLNRTCG